MLLASLVAITRNGCARSAFQPHLAGVFVLLVRTKTCPLFSAGRLKCCSRLSWLSQEMAVRDRHSSRIWPGCSLSGCGPKPVRFFLPVRCLAARVSRGYHKKWLCAIGIPAASGRGVRFLGADQNLSALVCRSSEMLLASLVAITRNGCARSAFQPHLAGVFAFWVRTKTCPLFAAGRLKCCSRLSWLSQEMAVRDRHSSRIWPGRAPSGCGPKPVRFLMPVV